MWLTASGPRTARADDLTFTADRACLSGGDFSAEGVRVLAGDVVVTARRVQRGPGGETLAEEVQVRPCGCVPLGLGARRVTLRGNDLRAPWGMDGLTLEGARFVVGSLAVPFAPRWWVVWGQRIGLLLPRVELRDGRVAAGPGVHVPLGASLGMDAWVLARGDGAELDTELHGEPGTLRLEARAGGANAGAARGALSWVTGRAVVSVRADGATTDAAGRSLARLPVESLRAGHDAAFGVSYGDQGGNAVASGGIELARRGDDLGARTSLAVASPALSLGRTVLSAQAAGGAWLAGTAQPYGDVAAGLTTAGALGPLDARGYARTEAYGTRGAGGSWSGLARGGGSLALGIGRRLGGADHRVRVTVGAGAEGGTVSTRMVASAAVRSDLRGAAWRWTVGAEGRVATGGDLPPRVEARTELSAWGLSLGGRIATDAVVAAAEASGRWADARGDLVSIRWARRARSAWDGVPSWEQPESGPLDLEGVRARRRDGESVAAAAAATLGPVGVRADGAVDVATGAPVLVGGAVRLRAACGCAWAELGGFWVRGGEVIGLLSARFGGQ